MLNLKDLKPCPLCKNTYENLKVKDSGYSSLNDYLVANEKVGITDIDTRSLVRHIRHKGAMNAIISSENLDENELKALVNLQSNANVALINEMQGMKEELNTISRKAKLEAAA